jgi:dolichol-phosphate mannosyltransferase
MYNEQAGAEACVRAVCEELRKLPHRSALIVVNDGSKDQTGEILGALAPQEPKLTLVNHPGNRGYGAALRTGVGQANQDGYDYVLFMDSDLTNHPRDIPRFVSKMEEGYDVIKASRYTAGGGMQGVPLSRAWVSRAGNGIARFLFSMKIRDCTNGFRAVKTALLAPMDLRERGFAVIVEELYHCKFVAQRSCEIPVVLTNRKTDQRATSFSYRPQTFLKYLKYGLLARLGVRPPRQTRNIGAGNS